MQLGYEKKFLFQKNLAPEDEIVIYPVRTLSYSKVYSLKRPSSFLSSLLTKLNFTPLEVILKFFFFFFFVYVSLLSNCLKIMQKPVSRVGKS